jgi:hypothetical protein
MRRLCFPSPALLLCLALLAPACREDLTLTGKVVEASSTQYVIEIQTKPGIEVDVSGVSATTDDQGIARLVVPVERLSYMGGATDLNIMAIGGNFVSSYAGFGTVELPFSPNDAAKVGDATHWVKFGSGQNAVSGGSLWSFGDMGGSLMNADGSVTVAFQAPAKSTVSFLDRTVAISDDGRGEITFTPEETLGLVSSESLMGGYGSAPAVPVPVKLTLADGSAKDMAVSGAWSSVSGEPLRARLAALPQQPMGGERNPERLVVHLDAKGSLSASGRKGLLTTIDIASIGTAQTPRKLADCDGYTVTKDGVDQGGTTFSLPREAIDEEVVATDAHTGKELGRKVFAASDYCPSFATSDQRVLEVRPSQDEVLAWVMAL